MRDNMSMHRIPRIILAPIVGSLLLVLPTGCSTVCNSPAAALNGLQVQPSHQGFAATVGAARAAIESKGLRIMAEVDHGANAEGIADLRPTHLFVFGNPKAGTQLMLRNQSVGIDLPMKLLVWEAENGQVHVQFNDPSWLAARHGIDGPAELLTKMGGALSSIAAAATSAGDD